MSTVTRKKGLERLGLPKLDFGELSSRGGAGAAATARPAWQRMLSLVLMLGVLLTVVGGALFAATAAHADDDNEKLSFYRVTSVLSVLRSENMSPSGDMSVLQSGFGQNPGNAGAVLAYSDPKWSEDFAGWASSKLSISSDSLDYDSLGDPEATGRDSESAMTHYVYYGAALNSLGFDQAKNDNSFDLGRMIGGPLMLSAYTGAFAANAFFESTLDLLKYLNPFKFFFQADGTYVNPLMGSIGDRENTGFISGALGTALSGIDDFVSSLYEMVSELAWAILVPIFIGVFVVSLLLLKKGNTGGRFKRLVIRLAFIGIGVPLLGMLYTSTLDMLSNDVGGNGSSRVVASTFVDFGGWTRNARLAPPEGAIAWDVTRDSAKGESALKVRNTAIEINRLANPNLANVLGSTTGDDEMSYIDSTIKDQGEASGGWFQSWSDGYSFGAMADILNRYTTGAQVSAADFETSMKKSIRKAGDSAETTEGWFEALEKPEIMQAGNANDNPLIVGGKLSYSGGTFSANGANAACKYNVGTDSNCNLSPLSMYNYLNTSFGDKSMTMYSSGTASSALVRQSHMEVNVVGTGIMSFLYWTNSYVLLMAMTILAVVYAFALIFASIKRTFHLVAAVPFAVIGFMGGIAKVIIYSLALIAEVVMTIAAYTLIQMFLMALPSLIEVPVQTMMNGDNAFAKGIATNLAAAGIVIPMMNSIVSLIMIIVFVVLALKVRKGLVKAVEEAVTKIVNRLTDTQVGSGGAPGGMLPALAGGAAAGMGAAAASRMMGGGSKGADGSGAGGEGPGSIGVGSDTAAEAGDVSEQTAIESTSGDQAQIESGDSSTASDVSSGTYMEASDGAGALPEGAVGRDADGNPVDASGNVVSDTGSAGQGGSIDADSRDRQQAAQAMENGLPQGASPQGAGGTVDAGGPEKQVSADGGSGPGQHDAPGTQGDAPKAQDPAAAAMLLSKGKGLAGGQGEQAGGSTAGQPSGQPGGASQNGLPKGPGQRSQPGAQQRGAKAPGGQGQQPSRTGQPSTAKQSQQQQGSGKQQAQQQAQAQPVPVQQGKQQRQGLRPPISPQTAGFVGLGMAQSGISAAQAKREAKERERRETMGN